MVVVINITIVVIIIIIIIIIVRFGQTWTICSWLQRQLTRLLK